MLASLLVLESVLDLDRMLIELRLPIFDLALRIGDRGELWLCREEIGESSPPCRGEPLGEKLSLVELNWSQKFSEGSRERSESSGPPTREESMGLRLVRTTSCRWRVMDRLLLRCFLEIMGEGVVGMREDCLWWRGTGELCRGVEGAEGGSGAEEICPREVRAATSMADDTPRIEVLEDVSTYMTAWICWDIARACCEDTGDLPAAARP